MANTTIGLDIGARALRYALCNSDGAKAEITAFGTIPVHPQPGSVSALNWDAAYAEMAEIMAPYRKIPLEGIGMCVDPTRALTLHKLMPFNDPRILGQVLPQALTDTWNVDDDTQIAFEVGGFVKGVQTDPDDESSVEGYDIHVVNYPKGILREEIEKSRAHEIDPHVVLTSTDAIRLALPLLVGASEEEVWCIFDIGEKHSEFFICRGTSILASRACKIGGSTIDDAIARAFEVSVDEARKLKEESAFLSTSGKELEEYDSLLNEGRLQPCEVDVVRLSQTVSQAMLVLLSGIRQMILQNTRKLNIEPTKVYLIGGGAKLCGLERWLSRYFGVDCREGLPFKPRLADGHSPEEISSISLGAAAVAICAQKNSAGKCPLNLRRGDLAHKGSLAVLQEKKWVLISLVLLVLIASIVMTATKERAVQAEYDRVRAALEDATQNVFGKKMLSYREIEKEIADSQGFSFIPERTAFTHFSWISSHVNDNLSDVEMDLDSLDIDMQRKIVTITGLVSGDDGLPKFMQLLEQYECFPNEIQEQKTSQTKDRVSFMLRFKVTNCSSGDDGE